MTDITELAQSLKAAAEKATPGEWRRASTQFNGITATPFMLGRKEVMIAGVSEKRDAEFIALANPANILALVEALEKAQQRIAELEEAEQKLCAANVTLDARAELAERQRIAELESRTVSVKLLTPEVRNALKAEGLADVLKDAAEYAPLTAGQWETLTKNWYQTFIGLSGTAAGIKVEAE
ncbi:TPA: ead/Ea22-like family protein [Klebsiella pneumoniae]|nr:ead/Ea22-like family protein [Klebsiella pneumoniae]